MTVAAGTDIRINKLNAKAEQWINQYIEAKLTGNRDDIQLQGWQTFFFRNIESTWMLFT